SNLATWVTTLAVNALAAAAELDGLDRKTELREWLERQQYKERHPYTGADRGGWAWTDLPGGVPDGDDTPGALLALSHLMDYVTDENPEPASPRAFIRWSLEGSPDGQEVIERLPPTKDIPWAARPHILSGLWWLLRLQNADGGWPTFCRGWGHLPFDRSGADLTAHALRALAAWKSQCAAE